MIDGQHRCMAVVKTGIAIPIMVTYGVSEDVMSVLDIGKKRSVSDMFHLYELKNASLVASAIGTYKNIINEVFNRTIVTSHKPGSTWAIDEKYGFYLENEQLFDKLIKLSMKCYKASKFFSHTLIVGLSLYLIKEKNATYNSVEQFWSQCHLLEGFTQTPATRLLSSVMMKYSTGSEQLKIRNKLALTAKAWNLYKKGTTLKYLKFDETRESMPTFN